MIDKLPPMLALDI